mgnify:CR=1 FL=1
MNDASASGSAMGLPGIEPFDDSSADVSALLAQRAPARRSRLRAALIITIVFLLGMLIGVGLGRAAATLPSGGTAPASAGQD